MNKVCFSIGGNIGDRKQNLANAIKHISSEIGSIISLSSIYETSPWGDIKQKDFLNQVILVSSELSAEKCMEKILLIEQKLGRIRTIKNASRNIDIDILFYNNDILDAENLVIPHPEIANRRFVLVPLCEIDASYIHPVLNKTLGAILTDCEDPLEVKWIGPVNEYLNS